MAETDNGTDKGTDDGVIAARLLASAGNGNDPNFLPEELDREASEAHQDHTEEAIAELLASEGHGSDPNFLPQEIDRLLHDEK